MRVSVARASLVELVEATVRDFSDHRAVDLPAGTLTYDELWATAARIASALLAAGCRGRAVGLHGDRTALAYAGYLACLRAGSTVVPLDPDDPADRVATMASMAGVAAVLAVNPIGTHLTTLLAGAGTPIIDIKEALTHRPTAAITMRTTIDPDDIAYILFTSGSSGTPKGVPITHRNAVAYVTHSIERFEVRPASRLSQTFSLVFDPSVFGLFAAWGAAATLVVPVGNEVITPVRFVRRRGISHWFSVPSAISLARMSALPKDSMPGLRWSMFIGDQLTWDQARVWLSAAPSSILENVYGPTELTVACAGYRPPADQAHWPRTSNGTVPIGEVYPHLESAVVDADGRATTDGELCVRGNQRFAGYLDPANNSGAFLVSEPEPVSGADQLLSHSGTSPAMPDAWYRTGDRVRREAGTWVHLERLDRQVQLGGVRVEPGEVEAALRDHPRIDDAVVVVTHDRRRLHAFCVGTNVEPHEIREAMLARLPQFMVPAAIDLVPRLPLTANGKVDRGRLANLAAGASADWHDSR